MKFFPFRRYEMRKRMPKAWTLVNCTRAYVWRRTHTHVHMCSNAPVNKITGLASYPPISRCYSLLLSCVIARAQVVAQNNTSKSNVPRAWGKRVDFLKCSVLHFLTKYTLRYAHKIHTQKSVKYNNNTYKARLKD